MAYAITRCSSYVRWSAQGIVVTGPLGSESPCRSQVPKSIARASKRESAVLIRRRSPSDAPINHFFIHISILDWDCKHQHQVHTVIKNVWLQVAVGLQVMCQLWLLLHWHIFCGHKDQGQVWNQWDSKMWLQVVVGPQWYADFECTHINCFSVGVSIKATATNTNM